MYDQFRWQVGELQAEKNVWEVSHSRHSTLVETLTTPISSLDDGYWCMLLVCC
jgi:hypothetical protein